MNKKGFTIIELLGAVVILGILAGIAIQAVEKNNRRTKEQAVFTIAKTAYEATQARIAKGTATSPSYNISDLYKDGFMDRPLDPDNNGKDCTGTVQLLNASVGSDDKVDSYDYKVTVNCPSGISDVIVFHSDGSYDSTNFKTPTPTPGGTGRPKVSNAPDDEDDDGATYHKVMYDPNGGSGAMASSLCRHGETIVPKENKFVYPGHTFTGWTYSTGSTKCTSDVTLKANWSGLQYVVHYAANGGTGTMPDSYCTAGTAFVASANKFTKTGYNFAGWQGQPSICKGEVTLTAKWTPGTYTVTYSKGDTNPGGTVPNRSFST